MVVQWQSSNASSASHQGFDRVVSYEELTIGISRSKYQDHFDKHYVNVNYTLREYKTAYRQHNIRLG